MPLPEPHADESKSEFMGRCMETLRDEYPDQDQRVAVCLAQWGDNRAVSARWESRAQPGLEVRQESGRRPRLVGYAAVFNTRSVEIPPGFVEVIRPGAFARSLRSNDIRAFVDHDPGRIIGRASAQTLLLEEDSRGLRVEITPIETRDGEDVVKNVRAGNLDGMSFGFQLYDWDKGQRWDHRQQPPVREILEANVLEVSVVAMPAYPETSVAVRAWMQGRQERTVQRLQDRMALRQRAWMR
jgi:HK97 family phage prohead protease